MTIATVKIHAWRLGSCDREITLTLQVPPKDSLIPLTKMTLENAKVVRMSERCEDEEDNFTGFERHLDFLLCSLAAARGCKDVFLTNGSKAHQD